MDFCPQWHSIYDTMKILDSKWDQSIQTFGITVVVSKTPIYIYHSLLLLPQYLSQFHTLISALQPSHCSPNNKQHQ